MNYHLGERMMKYFTWLAFWKFCWKLKTNGCRGHYLWVGVSTNHKNKVLRFLKNIYFCVFIYCKISKYIQIHIGAEIFIGAHKTKNKSNSALKMMIIIWILNSSSKTLKTPWGWLSFNSALLYLIYTIFNIWLNKKRAMVMYSC